MGNTCGNRGYSERCVETRIASGGGKPRVKASHRKQAKILPDTLQLLAIETKLCLYNSPSTISSKMPSSKIKLKIKTDCNILCNNIDHLTLVLSMQRMLNTHDGEGTVWATEVQPCTKLSKPSLPHNMLSGEAGKTADSNCNVSRVITEKCIRFHESTQNGRAGKASQRNIHWR